jgi:hypothetical protein
MAGPMMQALSTVGFISTRRTMGYVGEVVRCSSGHCFPIGRCRPPAIVGRDICVFDHVAVGGPSSGSVGRA